VHRYRIILVWKLFYVISIFKVIKYSLDTLNNINCLWFLVQAIYLKAYIIATLYKPYTITWKLQVFLGYSPMCNIIFTIHFQVDICYFVALQFQSNKGQYSLGVQARITWRSPTNGITSQCIMWQEIKWSVYIEMETWLSVRTCLTARLTLHYLNNSHSAHVNDVINQKSNIIYI
jgi:hypothetical protein